MPVDKKAPGYQAKFYKEKKERGAIVAAEEEKLNKIIDSFLETTPPTFSSFKVGSLVVYKGSIKGVILKLYSGYCMVKFTDDTIKIVFLSNLEKIN